MENKSTPAVNTTAHFYNDRSLSSQQKVKVYDDTAPTYDQRVTNKTYTGPRKCADIAAKYYPHNRENISVFDVGCGTGQAAEEMQKMGFKVIDGLDPSEGMLKESEKRNIYRSLYCDYFTSKALALPKDSYDLLTVVGSMNIGIIPFDAVIEMIRLTKPGPINNSTYTSIDGGIVCIINRKATFYEFQEYAQFFPLCDKLEKEGKWNKEEISHFSGFLDDADGIVIVYRVK